VRAEPVNTHTLTGKYTSTQGRKVMLQEEGKNVRARMEGAGGESKSHVVLIEPMLPVYCYCGTTGGREKTKGGCRGGNKRGSGWDGGGYSLG